MLNKFIIISEVSFILLLHVQIFFTIAVAHICHIFSNELNSCLVRTSNFVIVH